MKKRIWRVPQWLITRPIAHRGLHCVAEGIPENSLAAFERAATRTFPAELDVHLLKDEAVAVFHDDSLLRMTGVDRRISEITSREAAGLRLLNTSHPVPLLNDVLDLIDGRVPLLIEVKNRGTGDAVGALESRVLQILAPYRGEFAIQSFNPIVLKWFRLMAPQILRGQLAGDSSREELPSYQKFLQKNFLHTWISEPHFLGYDIRCLPYWPVSLSSRARPLLGYTATSPEDHRKAMELCDNVIFQGYDPSSWIRETRRAEPLQAVPAPDA